MGWALASPEHGEKGVMPTPGRFSRNPNLEITRRQDGDVETLALYGEVEVVTCEDLAANVRRAWDRGTRVVVVDLTGVTLIDSSGIRCLTTLQAESGAGRSMEIIAPRRHVQRVLEIAGVAHRFTYRTIAPGGRPGDER